MVPGMIDAEDPGLTPEEIATQLRQVAEAFDIGLRADAGTKIAEQLLARAKAVSQKLKEMGYVLDGEGSEDPRGSSGE
jgi:hypothetical protein